MGVRILSTALRTSVLFELQDPCKQISIPHIWSCCSSEVRGKAALKPREGPAGMGRLTAGCQSPPRCHVPSPATLRGDEDTPRGSESEKGKERCRGESPETGGAWGLELMALWTGSLGRGLLDF